MPRKLLVLEIVARNRAVTRTWVGELIRCELPTVSPATGTGSLQTRHFNHVLTEIREFFATCRAVGAWPGGVHVELTVTT